MLRSHLVHLSAEKSLFVYQASARGLCGRMFVFFSVAASTKIVIWKQIANLNSNIIYFQR